MNCRNCPNPCEDGGRNCHTVHRDFEEHGYEGSWESPIDFSQNRTTNYKHLKGLQEEWDLIWMDDE